MKLFSLNGLYVFWLMTTTLHTNSPDTIKYSELSYVYVHVLFDITIQNTLQITHNK